MNTFLKYFFGILPGIIHGVSMIPQLSTGASRKQAVLDALEITAVTVSALAPQHEEAANTAARTAAGAVDGIYALLKELGTVQGPPKPSQMIPIQAPRTPDEPPALPVPMHERDEHGNVK